MEGKAAAKDLHLNTKNELLAHLYVISIPLLNTTPKDISTFPNSPGLKYSLKTYNI